MEDEHNVSKTTSLIESQHHHLLHCLEKTTVSSNRKSDIAKPHIAGCGFQLKIRCLCCRLHQITPLIYMPQLGIASFYASVINAIYVPQYCMLCYIWYIISGIGSNENKLSWMEEKILFVL